jgi:hypothetical protein
MKKVIKLTEGDINRIVKKVINEEEFESPDISDFNKRRPDYHKGKLMDDLGIFLRDYQDLKDRDIADVLEWFTNKYKSKARM